MTLESVFLAIEALPFAKAIREGTSLFPWIESVHVLAIVIVVGTVIVMDLALLGVASHSPSLRRLIRDANPITWMAFGVAAITGSLLFASSATGYVKNPAFLIKFVAMGLAGLNMVLFHAASVRSMDGWDAQARPPARARIAGLISISCWVVVVGAGRWIGFLT